jgi:hypothetical protein
MCDAYGKPGHKHHSGPFATRDEAETVAEAVRDTGRRVLDIAVAVQDDDEPSADTSSAGWSPGPPFSGQFVAIEDQETDG